MGDTLQVITDLHGRKWIGGENDYFWPLPLSVRAGLSDRGFVISYSGWVHHYRRSIAAQSGFKDKYKAFLEKIDFKEDIHDTQYKVGSYYKQHDGLERLVRITCNSVVVLNPVSNEYEYVCTVNNPAWKKLSDAKRRPLLDEFKKTVVTVEEVLECKRRRRDILTSKTSLFRRGFIKEEVTKVA